MSKRNIRCACCDHFGPHGAHDWCSPCYVRWLRAGQPEDGPPARHPDPVEAAAEGRRRAAAGRREDYQDLRSWGTHREMAAQRLGVSLRTTQRYDRALRELAIAGEAGTP